jgi:drug/metabolite transporter (DMT)-like permease
LAAAFLHAGWNLLLHANQDRMAVMAVSSFVGVLLLLPGLVLAPPPASVLPLALASGVAQSAYIASLSAGYRRGALSLVYPLARGTAPLLVTGAAVLVLSQHPSGLALIGAGGLAAGLAVLALAGRTSSGAAVAFALMTGVFIATYSTIDARAVRTASPAGYLAVVTLVLGVVLASAIRWDGQRMLKAARSGTMVAFGTVGAYLLVLLAFQRAPAGRVATLRELSVLIGILMSRERPGRVVWLGAALVVLGIVAAGV